MPPSTRSPCPRPRPAAGRAALILLAAGLAAPAHGQATHAPGCVDVRVGSARSYDCLNQAFRAEAGEARAPADPSVLSATAAPPRVGLYNQAGTREHLGANFGISAFPAARPGP